MTQADLERYAKENDSTPKRYHANGTEFVFVRLRDNWQAIFMKESNGTYTPMTQAADEQHAREYCAMLEPMRVPFTVI